MSSSGRRATSRSIRSPARQRISSRTHASARDCRAAPSTFGVGGVLGGRSHPAAENARPRVARGRLALARIHEAARRRSLARWRLLRCERGDARTRSLRAIDRSRPTIGVLRATPTRGRGDARRRARRGDRRRDRALRRGGRGSGGNGAHRRHRVRLANGRRLLRASGEDHHANESETRRIVHRRTVVVPRPKGKRFTPRTAPRNPASRTQASADRRRALSGRRCPG